MPVLQYQNFNSKREKNAAPNNYNRLSERGCIFKTVGEVAVLMEKNGIEEKLISQRNLNVCELIDMLETV